MLARYKIHRGKRPAEEFLPDGIRRDTRKHTRHCLRPTSEMVAGLLGNPTEKAWDKFAAEYRKILEHRFKEDRAHFDELAELASEADVFIGCSCPTKKNPDVNHCHTVLALRFMKTRYPELEVEFP